MAFLVYLLGWRGPAPAGDRWQCLHVRAGDLPALGDGLLVLGERALGTTTPDDVRAWLSGGRRRALLCVARCESSALDGWLHEGRIELVAPERLAGALDVAANQAALAPAPWPLEPAAWLPSSVRTPEPGSEAHRLLRELPHHRPLHRTRKWAKRCGTSYLSLRVVLREATGLHPSELAQLFVLAQAEQADRDDVRRVATAGMLGYAGESELAHAMGLARRLRERLDRPSRPDGDDTEPPPPGPSGDATTQ